MHGWPMTSATGSVQRPRGNLKARECMILVGKKFQALRGQPGPPEGGVSEPPWLMAAACALFQVRLMITDAARHKLLVLTGQCFENTGELILQSGSFSFQNFIEIFTDQEVGSCLGVSSFTVAWSLLSPQAAL